MFMKSLKLTGKVSSLLYCRDKRVLEQLGKFLIEIQDERKKSEEEKNKLEEKRDLVPGPR